MESNGNPNTQFEVQINKPGRVLHFSDGVDEEVEQESVSDLRSEPTSSPDDNVDPVSSKKLSIKTKVK
jgi:hypothetical protein